MPLYYHSIDANSLCDTLRLHLGISHVRSSSAHERVVASGAAVEEGRGRAAHRAGASVRVSTVSRLYYGMVVE